MANLIQELVKEKFKNSKEFIAALQKKVKKFDPEKMKKVLNGEEEFRGRGAYQKAIAEVLETNEAALFGKEENYLVEENSIKITIPLKKAGISFEEIFEGERNFFSGRKEEWRTSISTPDSSIMIDLIVDEEVKEIIRKGNKIKIKLEVE